MHVSFFASLFSSKWYSEKKHVRLLVGYYIIGPTINRRILQLGFRNLENRIHILQDIENTLNFCKSETLDIWLFHKAKN